MQVILYILFYLAFPALLITLFDLPVSDPAEAVPIPYHQPMPFTFPAIPTQWNRHGGGDRKRGQTDHACCCCCCYALLGPALPHGSTCILLPCYPSWKRRPCSPSCLPPSMLCPANHSGTFVPVPPSSFSSPLTCLSH